MCARAAGGAAGGAAGAGPAAPGAAAAWERFELGGDERGARAGHTATVVGKYVYVCGGRRG
jgi:hypothetical protein